VSRATLQDLGLALLTGTLVGVSPFTPNDLVPSLVAGAVVAGLVLRHRMVVRARVEEVGAAPPAATFSLPLRSPLFWATALALVAVFAPTLRWLYQQWTVSIWQNDHGIFTPLVMAFFARSILRRDTQSAGEDSLWGLPLVAAGLALVFVDAAIRTFYLSAVGLVLVIPGLSLLLLGARRTRALAFPLVLGLFLLPIPNVLATHIYLRRLTAAGAEPILRQLDYTFMRFDTTFVMPNSNILISDACSGFAALYAVVGVALILAVFTDSRWRRAALLLSAVPLAFTSNIVRAVVLVVLVDVFGPALLETPIHEASGAATFCVVLLVQYAISGGRRTLQAILS
jgi:exosortase